MRQFLTGVALSALLAGANPALAETPDDQLIVAFTMTNVLTMDPAAITGGEAVQVLNNVYDALVELDPETKALMPRLAESWEIGEDNLSITFHLRPDAKFASGNPLTAADVKYSFDRVMTLGQSQSSGLNSRGFTAEGVDDQFQVIDDQTFRMVMPEPGDPKMILM